MPRTPLRAVRIPDDLWVAAHEHAHVRGETVSSVLRRALAVYVAAQDPAHELGQVLFQVPTSVGDLLMSAAAGLVPEGSSRFLVAQGVVMQRLGLDEETAAVFLRSLTISADAPPGSQEPG